MTEIIRPAAAFLAVLLATAPALAEPQCGPAGAVMSELRSRWHEEIISGGRAGDAEDKLAVVLTASGAGKTWSLVAVSRDGVACLLASGHDWKRAPRAHGKREGRHG